MTTIPRAVACFAQYAIELDPLNWIDTEVTRKASESGFTGLPPFSNAPSAGS
jgi:hypothetical protein